MKRRTPVMAAVLLAGTVLSGTAHAGWFDSKPKPDPKAATNTAAQQQQQPLPQVNLDNDIRQAQLMRASGDFDGATKSLAQMMLVYPDDPRIVGEYGKLLAQEGHSKDAVDFLRRATDLSPGDWTLYSALGVAYDQQRDTAKARMAYERALQIKPNDPAVLNNYALSRVAAGDLDGAKRMIAQAAATPGANPKIAGNVTMIASLTPVGGATTNVAYNPPPARLPANATVQRVPTDPKAGPVAVARAGDNRPVTSAPRQLAAEQAKKPAAPAKKKDATPSLRMTADASSP